MENNVIQKEKAQGFAEYAIIVVLISVFVFAAVQLTGTSVGGLYNRLICNIKNEDNCQVIGKEIEKEDRFSFYDDFNEYRASWEMSAWQGKNKKWIVEDGKLISQKNASVLFPESYDGNYDISLNDVTFSSEKRPLGLSLHFNSTNDGKKFSGYALRIDSKSDGNYAYFQEYANGKPVFPTISIKQKLPDIFDWQSKYDINVKVEGNVFTGYVNGVQVAQGSDDTYSEGQVGLVSHSNSEITIDSISVNSNDE